MTQNPTEMSKFIQAILLLILTFVIACNSTKALSSGETQQQSKMINANQANSQIKLSAFAKSFLKDLNEEIAAQKTNILKFKPSKSLISHYNLLYFNGLYYVFGIITTTKEFDKNTLKPVGFTNGQPMGNKMTVQIPLNSFYQFLKLKNIVYFEMNHKSNLN